MVFRRRPPFPRRAPLLRGRPVRRAVLRRLQIAHQLLEEGRWAQAAEHFEQIARAAEKRGVAQAPTLFLQAGRARLENGDHVEGLVLIQHAVDLLDASDQVHQLERLRPRIVRILKSLGLEREAMELDARMHQILDQKLRTGKSLESVPSHKRLPTKCPSCGGTLHPDEIDWFDSQSAACAYCGSVVRVE